MPKMLRHIVPGIIVLLVLAACATAPAGVARIDSISPASAPLGEAVQVRVLGENFSLAPAGSTPGAVQVEVCGAPLTDVTVGATQTRPLLLPPGAVINMIVSGELTGNLGAGSIAGISDVVVTLARGERLVLEDAFECLDATVGPELVIEPASWAGYPNETVSLTAFLDGEPATDVTWSVSGGWVIEQGNPALWQPPYEPGIYEVSAASGTLTASSEFEVLDRQQAHVSIPGAVELTGFAVNGEGSVALSAQLAEYGAAYVYDPETDAIRDYGSDSFASYRVQLNDIAWDGPRLLAVGSSTYNSTDGQPVAVDIEPTKLVPDVTWQPLVGTGAEHVAVAPGGERYMAGTMDGDIYLATLDAATTVVSAVQVIGGSGQDAVTALAAGPDGRLYIAGVTAGPDFEGHAAVESAFLLAYDPAAGAVDWLEFMDNAALADVFVAPSGTVYVAGWQAGQALAASYDPTGAQNWATPIEGWAAATGIVTADDSQIYVTGTQPAAAFAARLDGAGEPVWRHTMEPAVMRQSLGISLAPDESVIVVGDSGSGGSIVWLAP